MDTGLEKKGERVRENTPDNVNQKIDALIIENISRYENANASEIEKRIKALDKEWDIERVLELNMSIIAITGIVLAYFVHVYWLILPAVVLMFFLQHAVQGWCPPIPVFRAFKVRTRPEIDREKYALKAMRNDFETVPHNAAALWAAVNK